MPKRSYTLAFKRIAVQKSLPSSNRAVAREIGVDERRIREWRSQLPRFDALPGTSAGERFRLQGGGRKHIIPEVEQSVADWVVQQREGYHRVTRQGIALKAKQLGQAQGQEEFKASRGWVDTFQKRNDFCH